MMLAHVVGDLVGEIVARVVHGQHDAVDGEAGIERLLHLIDGLEQLRQSFEREELALQRHQDRVRRRHRIDGEKIERRRTVDQHIGEIGAPLVPSSSASSALRSRNARSRSWPICKFETGEIERRRRDRQARHHRRHHRVAQRRFAGEHVIG